MASLLKNQIVKHLAKFFKNLSADSLNLSLRGTCHLTNLELNEVFLMEIFEFPVWLNCNKAICNKCFINVPYTKIKSQACELILDQIYIEIETVENFRQNTNYFNRLSNLSSGKYGLGERIIDGLKVKIDSVEIHFKSSAFNAQLTLLQIMVESRLPNFNTCNNISQTKIKDTNRNQILIFKHIEWQSLRFEARSETKTEEFQTHSSPLRLITRNGNCKVTLKKNLLDCSTISGRLQLNFDDLLWIATDATVLSAIQLTNYITQLMNKAPMNKKNLMNESPKHQSSKKNSTANNLTDISRLFSQFDIIETSMHLIINRLQLHLSDDLNRSSFSSLKNGGGLHVILQKLLVDFYPYHKAVGSRSHWLYYTEPSMSREPFINDHLKSFQTFQTDEETKNYSNLFSNSTADSGDKRLKDLLSFTILLRIGDYKVNCVSTSEDKNRDKKFSKDERVLISTGAIPKDLPAIFIEIQQYYYLEYGSTKLSTRLKSPVPTMFLNVAPSFINFDIVSLLWVNSFYSSIHKSLLKLASTLPQTESDDFHILAEIILPTFRVHLKNLYNECNDEESPFNKYEQLEIKSTKISIKNSKGSSTDLDKLDNLFSKLRLSKLFQNQNKRDYPWISENDFNYDCEKLISNLKKEINILKNYNNQFLIVNFQPFWLDFKCSDNLIASLIEPFDLTLWIQINKDIHQTTEPNLNVYGCFPDSIKVHLDHNSYLYLIRLLERIDHFSNIAKSDFNRICSNDKESGIEMKPPLVLISTVLSHIELFIKMNTYDSSSGLNNLNNNLSDKNSSDKNLSDFLSEENCAEDKDDFSLVNTNASSNDLVNDDLNNQLSSTLNRNGEVNNTNPFMNQMQQEDELIIEQLEPISTNSNPFLGIFTGRNNGYTSISSSSVNTSLIEEDTRSIKSDLSIESEKFVFNFDEECNSSFAFRSTDEDNLEEGVEITEDTLYEANLQEKQVNRFKKASSVTYLKLILRNVSFLNQTQNFIASILATVQELELNSYFKVPYDQFESDCSSNLDLFKPIDYQNKPNLLARVDTDQQSTSTNKEDKEMITAILQHLNLKTLDKRFIDCLSDFLLDEDALEVSKVKVFINDLKLKIKDEQLKTAPIDVSLKNLLLERNVKNEINIGPADSNIQKNLLIAHQQLLGIKTNKIMKEDEIEFTKEEYLRLLEENRLLKLKLDNL